jgi:hypothetical protein
MILLGTGIIFVVSLIFAIIFFVKYRKAKRALFLIFGIIFTMLALTSVLYVLAAILLVTAID